ncbi:TPA: cell surface protein, partial [Streptococcus suis]|nr:cell surface protein [Streptococcus suis]
MSKQKVVSSLLLSTVVLGGLAFYSTTTVKAESLEPDVTSVNASDATNKPVVPNEEESDFLAEEEELEESDAPVETLNEEIKDVTEPESVLRPRAMRSVLEDSEMESFPMEDSESESGMTIKGLDQVQDTNRSALLGKSGQENYKNSVSIEPTSVTSKGEVSWKVTFNPQNWSFHNNKGGYYLLVPKGLTLTKITENNSRDITSQFPTNVNSESNNQQASFRFFGGEEASGERSLGEQWNWSVGLVGNSKFNEWKNRFSSIYYIDDPKHTNTVEYVLTAQMDNVEASTFPLMAVIKNFDEKNHNFSQVVAVAGREIVIEKTKVQKPKEEAPKTNPEAEVPQLPAPEAPKDAPETPEEKAQVPESPKQETPEAPQAPSTPEKQPDAPEAPKEETPKEEVPQTPQEPKEQPKETPEVSPKPEEPQTPPAPSTPEKQPEVPVPEEPKKEEEPGQELPKPMEPKVDKLTPEVPQVPDAPKDEPQVPSIPEEQPKETPKPEVPSTPEKQPEAPKEEPKQDAPQTPQAPLTPDKQPEAPKEDTP